MSAFERGHGHDFVLELAVADGGGSVRAINAKQAAAKFSRKDIDLLTEYVIQDFGAKGLAWFKVDDGGKLASPIAKNFDDGLLAQIADEVLLTADETMQEKAETAWLKIASLEQDFWSMAMDSSS